MVKIRMSSEKTMWQKHGKWFLSGFVVFLLSYGGMQYYQYYQTRQALKASALYDKMIFAMQKRDTAEVQPEGEELTRKFTKTPYASLAALLLAKLSTEENNLVNAKEYLQF